MMQRWLWQIGTSSLMVLTLGSLAHAQAITSAKVVDIPRAPVYWRQPPAAEIVAEVGTLVTEGGYLRTEKPGKAQLELSNGTAFRLGGDAILQVSPDLQLNQGQIIAWTKPHGSGSPPSQSITTPVATAAIKGSTVFIEMSEAEGRFFSWIGDVEISLPDGKGSLILKSGEEVVIPSNAQQLPTPQKMSAQAIQERLTESEMINGFNREMDSLPQIKEELLP
ncbi:MAG: FecR domain-containing protein [Cyanobacteriota bacterium]|nr:FecR domain-containing protein [Cyanobacteriota bacterium]